MADANGTLIERLFPILKICWSLDSKRVPTAAIRRAELLGDGLAAIDGLEPRTKVVHVCDAPVRFRFP